MIDLLLNPYTERQITNFINDPPHSLLIIGEQGSGKSITAQNIALSILKLADLKSLIGYPYWMHLISKTGAITIDEIRRVKTFCNLKTAGPNTIRRVVYIQDADSMTNEAQTALLKVLEEPPTDTLIILSSTSADQLLDTIISRTRQVNILPISKSLAAEYLKRQGLSTEGIDTNILISEGLAGALITLHENADSSNSLNKYIQDAKTILTADLTDRLLMVDALAKDKSTLSKTLDATRKILRGANRLAIDKNQAIRAKRLLSMLEAINESRVQLRKNANPKLVLSKLMTLL